MLVIDLEVPGDQILCQRLVPWVNAVVVHCIELPDFLFCIGIYTGSMYGDGSLYKAFPGEGRQDDKVLAIKIHETNRIQAGL